MPVSNPRRGEVWRYDPVMHREGRSVLRLIVSADSVNTADGLPSVWGVHVVADSAENLLSVPVGESWASVLTLEPVLRRRLVELVGEATSEQLDQVDVALRALLEL